MPHPTACKLSRVWPALSSPSFAHERVTNILAVHGWLRCRSQQSSQGDLVQTPFKLSLHCCRANFPDGLRPLRFFFLDALLPLCVGGSEVERFLVYFPLIANSSSSFNTTWSPATRNHCTCFNPLISGRQNFEIEVSDLCFSSPWSSICDIRASVFSDELPCHSIPIQF